jgi:hypothetical protein
VGPIHPQEKECNHFGRQQTLLEEDTKIRNTGPKVNIQEAYAIEEENGDHRWAESIQREMNNMRVAIKSLKDGIEIPPGYQFMKCHLIFDIKFDGFKFKSRMVAGGHMAETPPFLTYAWVVSRDTVRIALLMAALHDLDVKAADVENAYLTAHISERLGLYVVQNLDVTPVRKQSFVVRYMG